MEKNKSKEGNWTFLKKGKNYYDFKVLNISHYFLRITNIFIIQTFFTQQNCYTNNLLYKSCFCTKVVCIKTLYSFLYKSFIKAVCSYEYYPFVAKETEYSRFSRRVLYALPPASTRCLRPRPARKLRVRRLRGGTAYVTARDVHPVPGRGSPRH